VWHHGEKRFNKLQIRLLESDVYLAVYQCADLLLCRLCHSRMAMTQVRDSNTAGEIEHFATLSCGYVAARAALEDMVRETTDSASHVLRTELCQLVDAHGVCD
jgi:hypothetical protein